jgi:hypothetical protein
MLIVNYQHQGSPRTGCLEVTPIGGLKVVDCTRPKKKSRGLGDAVAKVTTLVGIKPCGGCKRRQEQLNRAIPVGTMKQLWQKCRYIVSRGK